VFKCSFLLPQVYPATIASIKKGKIVEFEDGKSGEFDVIVFATGYRTNVQKWLKVHYKKIIIHYIIYTLYFVINYTKSIP
jgi:NAD(P)H-nitrite reductase large subunit